MAKDDERVINTTDSIFKGSKKTDAQLQKENFKQSYDISKGERSEFEQSKIYAALFPDGLLTTYQGIVIELYFDGTKVELPNCVIDYVMKKINEKAEKVSARQNQFNAKKQEKLGEYQASE